MDRKFQKPWQAMPTRIIELGRFYAKKDTDFDHFIAFLLLDLGVESVLKAFLVSNEIQVLPKLQFHEIVQKVKSELENKNVDIDFSEVSHYHRGRNSLYHEAVYGIKSTYENLQQYAELAKTIAEELLKVDVQDIPETQQEPEKDTKDERFITDKRRQTQRSIQELTDELIEWFKCFHETCHFIAELKRPKIATCQVAAQIAHIRKNFIDEEEYVYDESAGITSKKRAEILLYFAQERLDLFNKLAGTEFGEEDQEYVDFLLMDVNHIYASIAISQVSEENDDNWEKYVDYVELIEKLPSRWNYLGKQDGEIYEEFNQIRVWLDETQAKLDACLTKQITDVVLPIDSYEFSSLDGL
jgi:hypothetical protein